MSTNDNGGSAFPSNAWEQTTGMTLRDYFAAKALQGWMASLPADAQLRESSVAMVCYRLADAMLEERK